MRITCLVPKSAAYPDGIRPNVLFPSDEAPLLPQLIAAFGEGRFVTKRGTLADSTMPAEVANDNGLDCPVTVAMLVGKFNIEHVCTGTHEYIALVMTAFARHVAAELLQKKNPTAQE